MFVKKNSLELKAPAKINLFLEVLGERDNGYHDIRSIMMPVSLYDLVTLEATDVDVETQIRAGRGTLADYAVSSDENLSTRAANALKKHTGYSGGARIILEKYVPMGGGLGGGSSNAAAVLVGLNDLWETGLPAEELMSIGAELGCDIPALVHGGAVIIEGLGEKVTPMDLGAGVGSGWWIVVVNPGFPVSTGDIYSMVSSSLTSGEIPYRSMVSALEAAGPEQAEKCLFNSLQEVAFNKYPLLEMIADDLVEAGALGSLLSGSGASVFGLARDEAHARCIADEMARLHKPPVWSEVVKTLPDGVMVAHGPLEA